MEGSSFLNSFMPTLPWWFLVLGLLALAAWGTVTRVRLWHAQQHQAVRPARALSCARDALATVIADPAVFGTARDQAVTAYEQVTEALIEEKTRT